MKRIITLLFAIVASFTMLNAEIIKHVLIDLYYDLDTENMTAKVTYQNNWSDNYKSLKSAVIPSTVTYNDQTYTVNCIGNEAFRLCSNLISINIPNTVTKIEFSAFGSCRGLTSIIIPNSVTAIEYSAFSDCRGLTSLTLSNNLVEIGDMAFSYCTGITSLSIPKSVTSIGDYAFQHCHSLTSIVVEEGNPVYDSRNNCNAIIETESNTLIVGCNTTSIPQNIRSIFYAALESCDGITSITLPSTLTSIDDYAFNLCTGLTEVYSYMPTPCEIGGHTFGDVNKSTCVLYVPEESIGLYQAATYWKEFSNILAAPAIQSNYTINYLDKGGVSLGYEEILLQLPAAPQIDGFTFLRWDVVAGTLADGISIQAVYTANVPTSAQEVVNPANKAQKLIRNGNVYILTDTKTYTVQGQELR